MGFENIVEQYYEPLYKFAFSLARTEADACDLTQQTFYVWATKGHQLRDQNKVKTWLFTTLHRTFLQSRRRETRFPHEPLAEAIDQLPAAEPVMANEPRLGTGAAGAGQCGGELPGGGGVVLFGRLLVQGNCRDP